MNQYKYIETMKTLKNKIKTVGLMTLATALLTGFTACEKELPAEIKVTRMEVSNTTNNNILLIEGDTHTVGIKTMPENAIDTNEFSYRYSTSNDAVFTVNELGEISAVSVGEAALTVWSINNTDLWTSCLVKVEKKIYPITSITIPDIYLDYYMGVDKKFDLGALVTVNPDNATTPEVVYSSSDGMIAEVNEYGEIYTKALGDVVITIKSVDGSGVEAKCTIKVRDVDYTGLLERSGWAITTSHTSFSDAVVSGLPECLIDDDINSCLAMVKPGKSAGGITVPATESVFFVVDMQTANDFDFFALRHRTFQNTTANLRVSKVAAYGSNDGNTYTELIKEATLATAATISNVIVDLPEKKNYRYLKITIEGWSNSGNTIQMSDFNVGTKKYQ